MYPIAVKLGEDLFLVRCVPGDLVGGRGGGGRSGAEEGETVGLVRFEEEVGLCLWRRV